MEEDLNQENGEWVLKGRIWVGGGEGGGDLE